MKAKAWRIISVIEALLMLVLIIWPIASGSCTGTLETVSGGTCYMKCHWTFVALPFIAALGLVSALLTLIAKNTESRRFLAIMTIACALCCILLTTNFGIGLCGKADMHCREAALIIWITAGVAIILGIIQAATADPQKVAEPKLKL